MIDYLRKRVVGYLTATRYAYLVYNCPRAALAEAEKLTPGKRSPTVSTLEVPVLFFAHKPPPPWVVQHDRLGVVLFTARSLPCQPHLRASLSFYAGCQLGVGVGARQAQRGSDHPGPAGADRRARHARVGPAEHARFRVSCVRPPTYPPARCLGFRGFIAVFFRAFFFFEKLNKIFQILYLFSKFSKL